MKNFVDNVRDTLRGKKTYLGAAIAVLTALLGWANGVLDAGQAFNAVVLAVQSCFIRAGISNG